MIKYNFAADLGGLGFIQSNESGLMQKILWFLVVLEGIYTYAVYCISMPYYVASWSQHRMQQNKALLSKLGAPKFARSGVGKEPKKRRPMAPSCWFHLRQRRGAGHLLRKVVELVLEFRRRLDPSLCFCHTQQQTPQSEWLDLNPNLEGCLFSTFLGRWLFTNSSREHVASHLRRFKALAAFL